MPDRSARTGRCRTTAPFHTALAVAAVALATVTAQPAGSADPQPDNCKGAPVPAALQPPGSPTVLLRAQAEGTQIYVCRAAPGGGFAWDFKAPEAVLTDASGKPIGKQFAGPTWQANDGSSVVGEVVASAPAPDGKDPPWQLLKATSHAGAGQFTKVRYIQRINTQSGAAAAGGCDAAHVGAEQRGSSFAIYMLFQ